MRSDWRHSCLLLGLLSLACAATPSAQDLCSTATPVDSLPFSHAGNTCAFADDYNEVCPFPPTGAPDVVYRYSPVQDEAITIILCTSDYDTKVYIYEDDCPESGSGLAIACNDDACGENGWRSRIGYASLNAGHDYYIVVDGYGSSDCGDYQIAISAAPPAPEEGDTCDQAIVVDGLPFSAAGNTCAYLDDYALACQRAAAGGKDIVYRYSPTQEEYIRIDLCASEFDSKVYVYESACPDQGGSEVAGCNDDACGQEGTRSLLGAVPLVAGRTYFIVVDGDSFEQCGAYDLRIDRVPPPDYPSVEIEEIPVGLRPIGICAHPSGERIYVAVFGADEVAVIDTQSDAVLETIPVGDGPYRIAAHPSGDYIYTANFYGSSMTVIQSSTNSVVDTVPLGENPIGVCVHPSGQFLYVTNYGSHTLSVIRTPDPLGGTTHTVIATIPVGAGPRGVCVHPSGEYVYTSNFDDATVSVIRTSDNTLVETVAVDYFPQAISALPSGDYVVVGNFGFDATPDHLSVISVPHPTQPTSPCETHCVVARVRVGTGPEEAISIDDGRRLYVTNYGFSHCCPVPPGERGQGLGSITVIETPDFSVLGDPEDPPWLDATVLTVPLLGDYTFGLCALPSGEKIYAVNAGNGGAYPTENTVSVIGLPAHSAGVEQAVARESRLLLACGSPRPAIGSVELMFSIPDDARREPVQLDICDVTGRLVERLVAGIQPAGLQRIVWPTHRADGEQVTAGIYFATLRAGHSLETQRFLLLH